MKHIKIVSILFVFLAVPLSAYGADVNDYLILNDIGNNKLKTQTIDPITRKPKPIATHYINKNSGVISGAYHFQDHLDMTYKTTYLNYVDEIGVKVQVTQHAGADSDQWLLHEIEDAYRDGNDKEGRLGLIAQGTRIGDIDGNKIIGMRGGI